MAVLGDQQVLQRGHVFEQAHVLEGSHQPVRGDGVATEAGNVFAFQHNALAAWGGKSR